MLRRTLCLCSIQRSFSSSAITLSGHNKWSKIKQKKGVNDAQKSMIYGKAARNIMVAVRSGGSADPDKNSALAAALRTAKAHGVPKANVDSALKKASGSKDKPTQLATFEAMAYGTVGVIIECLTDNANRTIHKLREILNQHNARLAPVGYLFERKGLVRVALNKSEDMDTHTERLMDRALVLPVEDFELSPEKDELEFVCATQDLPKVTALATEFELCRELLNSELVYASKEPPVLELEEDLKTGISALVESLEENEDVVRVYTTVDKMINS